MGTLLSGDMVNELHGDLARKYKRHTLAIESAWRSFDRRQRTNCVKAGAADGVVLRTSPDRSLGNVYKFVPEWNLSDITDPDSDFLLDHLRHRATKSLVEQYFDGMNGSPGDSQFIQDMMRTRGLRHIDPFKDCYTFFWEQPEAPYGSSIRIKSQHAETLADLAPAIRAGICLPQSTGELILERQTMLLQSLSIIIDDILEEGSQTRDRKDRPKKSTKAATAALSKLTIETPPAKVTIPDLATSAHDQKDLLEDYLALITSEPVVLTHAVNIWYFTRPELVADERGRLLPVHTNKYISGAFLEAVYNAVKAAAVWSYISRLLDLLQSASTDKMYRNILLQELSNICHLEYGRTQGFFKRHVQSATGSKWFKRVSNTQDNIGNARVTMKGNPEALTRSDPQLHYMLRLCQPDTNAAKAVDWLKKLGTLHEAHPLDREKLDEREVDSLYDLAVIIGFVQDLSSTTSLPPPSRKKGQLFVSRSQELEVELNQLRQEIDLGDFVIPIDNLLEPGMAEGALKTLDQFIIQNTGSKMGFLYQDLVEDCLSDLQKQYQQAKTKQAQRENIEVPVLVSTTQPLADRVEQRKLKEKTRPSSSTTYEIAPLHEMSPTDELSPSPQTFKVSSSTFEVFSTLFTKSQSRGSVSWTAFEGAMADLGFSVLPRFGSVYTFLPPESIGVKKSFTVHRPHKSRIEGHLILLYAQRLRRVYGWTEQTFVVP